MRDHNIFTRVFKDCESFPWLRKRLAFVAISDWQTLDLNRRVCQKQQPRRSCTAPESANSGCYMLRHGVGLITNKFSGSPITVLYVRQRDAVQFHACRVHTTFLERKPVLPTVEYRLVQLRPHVLKKKHFDHRTALSPQKAGRRGQRNSVRTPHNLNRNVSLARCLESFTTRPSFGVDLDRVLDTSHALSDTSHIVLHPHSASQLRRMSPLDLRSAPLSDRDHPGEPWPGSSTEMESLLCVCVWFLFPLCFGKYAKLGGKGWFVKRVVSEHGVSLFW